MSSLPALVQKYIIDSGIDVNEFTSQEKLVLNKIISEINRTGKSNLLESLYLEDYEEIPISFDEFVENPFYLGGSTDNGNGIWSAWRKELRYIFNPLNKIYLSMLSGAIGIGKSTIACFGVDYIIYKLLCLKNPAKFYKLLSDSKPGIALFNITLSKGYGVAFDKINTALKKSPWFLKHGSVIGTTPQTQVFVPDKDIIISVGSNADHFIGTDVFCLTGDVKVVTDKGILTLEKLSKLKETFRVASLSNEGTITLSDYTCCMQTQMTNELYVITLDNGYIIKGTDQHKLLLSKQRYKKFKNIVVGDEIYGCDRHLKVIKTDKLHLNYLEPMYDIVDAYPYNNFLIDTDDNYIVSHNCISGNTEVATIDGWKTINEIKNKKIPIYNVDTKLGVVNLSDPCRIHETKVVTKLCRVELENGTIIETTPDHKFLTTKGDYVEAQYLEGEDLMEVQHWNDECEPVGYIYETFCDVTNKKYIGKKHSSVFVKSYVGSGILLQKDIKKYGKEHFHTRVLKWCYSIDDLCESEYYYIRLYNAHERDDYYNLTIGGESFMHTDESKLKMSKIAKDRIKKYGSNTKGLIWVHNGDINKRIKHEELNDYLLRGYVKGARCGIKGVVFVHKNSEIKKVNKKELELYLSHGWELGTGVDTNKSKIHIYKDDNNKFIYEHELDFYLKDGWKRGRKPTNSNTFWVNKGEKRCMIHKELLEHYIQNGYIFGSNTHANKGTIYIYNDSECKRVSLSDFESTYKNLGYKKGRKIWMRRDKVELLVPFGEINHYIEDGWERVGLKQK